MVNLQGKESTALKTIKQSLDDNLNIIASDSRLKTIVDKIADSRYTFKLLGETSTLPIPMQRASMLYKNWLYIAGTHTYGCELIIIDINTMEIVKQVSLSTVSNYIPLIILRDDTYYYISFGGSGSHVLKGLLETGEIVNTTIQGVVDRSMCMDENYLYTVTSSGIIRKIDKITLNILQTSSSIYNSPLDVKCAGDYIYITGTGTAPNTGVIAKVAKSNINTIVTTSSNLYNNENTWRLLIDGIYIYAASATGVIKKWMLSDLSYVSAFFTTGNNGPIYTIKKALNNIWVGDSKGSTYRVSETGSLLARLQATTSANFALEIDVNNQILYRNASDDATIAKYQIIDNLQNNASTTAIKTADLISLNTAGTWLNTAYTLNNMAMTCSASSNGYLRQLSFTGTTAADSEFVIHDFNASKKLTASTNYILNGVKPTDSLSTVFVRLILAENADGTGATTTIEKVAGDFNVTTTTNLYYKISIIIKSGVTLSASLYNSIPTLYPK